MSTFLDTCSEQTWPRHVLCRPLLVAAALLSSVNAETIEVLHRFDPWPNGKTPRSALVRGADGAYWGTTGGEPGDGCDGRNLGTIFRLDQNGGVTTVHRFGVFSNPFDGFSSYPAGSLTRGIDDALYGVTLGGGEFNEGTLFRLDADGTFTTVHSFSDPNFPWPNGNLAATDDGGFLGTTRHGGSEGSGTLFRYRQGAGVTTLHSFSGPDGERPLAGLIEGQDGSFLGTTSGGGAQDQGTIFRLAADGQVTTLHSFESANGRIPWAGLTPDLAGGFVGTTYAGGAHDMGTVFHFSAAGVFSLLHSFNGSNDAKPQGTLTVGSNGVFLGTTLSGGSGAHGFGTVFRVTIDGDFMRLHSFEWSDGAYPTTELTAGPSGRFLGTTSQGGAFGYGAIYTIDEAGDFELLYTGIIHQGLEKKRKNRFRCLVSKANGE